MGSVLVGGGVISAVQASAAHPSKAAAAAEKDGIAFSNLVDLIIPAQRSTPVRHAGGALNAR